MPEISLGEPIEFYNGEVVLCFDKENHNYHLILPDGTTEIQDGVTRISNILDHSLYLVPWGCKVMYLKLLRTMPRVCQNGFDYLPDMLWADFVRIAEEAKSAHREHFEDAADVGLLAHGWIEESIKLAIAKNDGIVERMHPSAPDDDRAQNCGLAALKWMQAHNVRWLSTERKVYSKKWKYAGTCDGTAIVDSCDNPMCCPALFMDQLSVIDWKSSNHLRVEYLFQSAAYQQALQEEFGKEFAARWILRLGKEDGEFEAWHEKAFSQDFDAFLACLNLYRLNRAVEERMRAAKKLKTFRKREAKKQEKKKK